MTDTTAPEGAQAANAVLPASAPESVTDMAPAGPLPVTPPEAGRERDPAVELHQGWGQPAGQPLTAENDYRPAADPHLSRLEEFEHVLADVASHLFVSPESRFGKWLAAYRERHKSDG